ncbi:hypothetical protein QTP88_014542 [Uroleucon formosanum]
MKNLHVLQNKIMPNAFIIVYNSYRYGDRYNNYTRISYYKLLKYFIILTDEDLYVTIIYLFCKTVAQVLNLHGKLEILKTSLKFRSNRDVSNIIQRGPFDSSKQTLEYSFRKDK